jgi:hypothetical protein
VMWAARHVVQGSQLTASSPKDTQVYPNRLEPHRCQLHKGLAARVLRDALRAADRGSRTHTARRPTPGYGGVPPAPAP